MGFNLGLNAMQGISGIFQGGGFGMGYGFGVRLGYDAYGALKNFLTGKSKSLRYSTNPTLSHLGSGLLSALGLTDADTLAGATNGFTNANNNPQGLNTLEKQEGVYAKTARRQGEGYMDFYSDNATFMNNF